MDSDQGKVFIGGISWETNEEKLKEYFQGFGEVIQTVVMRDKISGKPRGFGFVVFADPDIVDRVLQDNHVIDGRTVEAKRALSREDQGSRVGISGGARNSGHGASTRTKKLFVGGLPPTINEDGFRQYFEAYGTVTDVVIMYDQQTNRPRGFGFVSFDSEDAVDMVLHKTFHDLYGKEVEVKRALPKDANPGGGRGGNTGSYQGYGSSGGNSSFYEGRMESNNRYGQSQNAGGGYPSYGSSGFSASSYGYGPANNGMGYGYGNPGYGGPAGGGYGNPNAGYVAPPSAQRNSWGSQAPSGYGYGNSQWGGSEVGSGQSPSAPSGYGNQGYGYGRNQASYGAVGGRAGSGPNSNSTAEELQAGSGGYDGRGSSGYGNLGWQSDPSQGSGNYGGGYGA